ncbi:dihydrodipicolinate reductase C-terminal domain-containing protein [Streptomyces sp. NPDC005576]|uniref:dihydrodipicolinate reductase C-terminal domain-containing protein n=1 Tax=Streptomyces sp. NPDC005576 TaxID=3364726 RepID=UPI0036BF2258
MRREPGPSVGVIGGGRLGNAIAGHARAEGLSVVLTGTRHGRRPTGTPDVVIDASGPGAQEEVREYCERNRTPLIECVSNLDDRQWDELHVLARTVPVVRAANLTLGHYLQTRLLREVAALPDALRPRASVRERHPVAKAHRPSATAVELGRTWSRLSGGDPDDVSSLRGGLPVSDHEVMWTWRAETLSLCHSVGSLEAAAAGAVAAARWVHGRKAGMESMDAVYEDLLHHHAAECP